MSKRINYTDIEIEVIKYWIDENMEFIIDEPYIKFKKDSKFKHLKFSARGKYFQILPYIKKKQYSVFIHKAIFYLVYRKYTKYIDHIDGTGWNFPMNLRESSQTQNNSNISVKSNKDSGLPKGVFLSKCGTTFFSTIKINGKPKYLGTYKTIHEAKQAYDKKSIEVNGEFHKS